MPICGYCMPFCSAACVYHPSALLQLLSRHIRMFHAQLPLSSLALLSAEHGIPNSCCLTLSYKCTIAVCRAACKHIGQKAAPILRLLLCVSSALFTSTTSLLPSSFTMYTLTAAAAAVLNTDHRRVVLYAVIGVIWGWAVAGIAFLPYAVYLLLIGSPWVYLPAGVVSLVGTVLPMVGFDRLFYGKWTVRCCSSSSVMTP